MADSTIDLGAVIVDNLIPDSTLIASNRTDNSTTIELPRPTIIRVPSTQTTATVNNSSTKASYSNYEYTPNFVGTDTITGGTGQAFSSSFPQFVSKALLNETKPNSNTKINSSESSNFYITFIDSKNIERTFIFSLMPAMENVLRGNNTGLAVPEVKPGLSFRTDMNTKKIAIPGARPIFQSLSIDKTIIQITAALIGNEEIVTKNKTTLTANYNASINRTTNVRGNELTANTGAYLSSVSKHFDAWSSAAYIDTNIVQTGRPVTLTIKSNTSNTDSNVSIVTRCLFQSFRYLSRYQDRCYYAFDLLSLDYLDKAAINIASTLIPKT